MIHQQHSFTRLVKDWCACLIDLSDCRNNGKRIKPPSCQKSQNDNQSLMQAVKFLCRKSALFINCHYVISILVNNQGGVKNFLKKI